MISVHTALHPLSSLPHPLPSDPPVEEFQTRLRLIQRHHMATGMQSHKCEVPTALHLTNLRALFHRGRIIGCKRQVVERDLAEGFLARPFQRFGPSVVAEPIADEVCVTLLSRD